MRTNIKFILSLILLISALYSCRKEETNTVVHGQILDSLTNLPIESVQVSLEGQDLFVYPAVLSNIQTDLDGRFQFKFEWDEKHNAYSIKAVKIGYKYSNSVFLKKGIDQNITIKLVKD